MKFLSYIAAAFGVLVLSFFVQDPIKGEQWADQSEKISNEITQKISKKLQKEDGLYLMGTGGGIDDTIREVYLGFFLYHPMDLEETRKFIVFLMNKIVEEVNEHIEWVPYFIEYPVSTKSFHVDVFIKNADRSNVLLNEIDFVSCVNNRIRYSVAQELIMGPAKTIRIETYQEAVDILCSQGKAPSGVPCKAPEASVKRATDAE